ncbi:SoxR reducing system RseC family protein [Gimesia panareensis]|uniref:SoxR reducing system RseC family protein n=1 Tax=Gimesia panareensis TaxID=2527978 RepID=UPI001188B8ED|nr:SoxR reducing system RseC family protein [Gimesia panareensis]QDU53293.1 hypothetical protein Pan110_56780 [Gimesia panareensis]
MAKASYTLREGRVYIHEKCQQSTQVNGGDFEGLCNPFNLCLGTVCAHCGGPRALSSFHWADTGEPLDDYRRRLRTKVPPIYTWWYLGISPLIGLIAGTIIGPLFLKNSSLPVAAGSALVGALIMYLIIGPKLLMLVAPKKYFKLR